MFVIIMSIYAKVLAIIVKILIYLSSAAVLAMMLVTIIDIIMRAMRIRFIGAVDVVQIAGTVCIAASLPYTTAVGGHVAIEFFFHKFSHRGRLILGSLLKMMTITLFSSTAVQCFLYGRSLQKYNQVTMTLQFPQCWIMYIISICLVVVVLVLIYNLLCPSKELMKV